MKTISILILSFLLIGCLEEGYNPPDPNGGFNSECRHKALIGALIYEEQGYATRIMLGPCGEDCRHAQAQYWEPDTESWVWIRVNDFVAWPDTQEDWFDPIEEQELSYLYNNMYYGNWM